MRLCTLNFILKEAGANIRRNVLMSLACVTTVMVTLAFSGFVLLAFKNAENILQHVAEELQVAVYLKMDVTPQQRDRVGAAIGAIRHVQVPLILVTREHAWQSFSATIPDSLKGEMDGNPLPDTYMVKVDAPFRVPMVAHELSLLPEVDKVNAPYLEAHRAAAILRVARMATDAVSALLVLVTTFLVMNTIRLTLYARRNEIRVMQLVGASNGYIRTPFVLEGLLLGFIGGVFACACLAAGYPYLLHLVHQSLAFDLPLITSSRALASFYAEILLVGAGVGTFGSIISVRRFLRPLEYTAVSRRPRPVAQPQNEPEADEVVRRLESLDEGSSLASVVTRNYPSRPDEHAAATTDGAAFLAHNGSEARAFTNDSTGSKLA